MFTAGIVRSGLAALVASSCLAITAGQSQAQFFHYQPTPRYYPAPHYLPQPWPNYSHGYGESYLYDERVYRPRPRVYHYREFRPEPQAELYSPHAGGNGSYGSVCVTSRGECSVGGQYPLGTGCKCNIPGFGRKRGHVQY